MGVQIAEIEFFQRTVIIFRSLSPEKSNIRTEGKRNDRIYKNCTTFDPAFAGLNLTRLWNNYLIKEL
jgi:hypothetical protein